MNWAQWLVLVALVEGIGILLAWAFSWSMGSWWSTAIAFNAALLVIAVIVAGIALTPVWWSWLGTL